MPKVKKDVAVRQAVGIQVIPTKEIASKRIYSNFVSINHSQYDSTLTFCDILPIDDAQKLDIAKSKKLNAPIQAEIVIPNSLVEPLIQALSQSYEKHKAKIK